jgi:hypothetical protein
VHARPVCGVATLGCPPLALLEASTPRGFWGTRVLLLTCTWLHCSWGKLLTGWAGWQKALRFKFSECQEAAAGVHHLQKELADREKSLLALSDRHELLCEKHEQLKMELGRAHAETEGAVKERKRLEATLKKVRVRVGTCWGGWRRAVGGSPQPA